MKIDWTASGLRGLPGHMQKPWPQATSSRAKRHSRTFRSQAGQRMPPAPRIDIEDLIWRRDDPFEAWFLPLDILLKPKPRIILVDDEPKILEGTSEYILSWYRNVEIAAFKDASQGWQALLRKAPSLFITDWFHPSPSGEEILTRLAGQKVKFPVLVISGGANEDHVRHCAGTDLDVSFLKKPWLSLELYRVLSKYFGPGDALPQDT